MRRILLAALLLVGSTITSVIAAAPATAADAPNTCATARYNRYQDVWTPDSIATASDVDWFRFTTTSSRYALITAGGVAGNVSLALYNSSCHYITSVDHTGRRFEQLYRYLAAGRYFVRVAGVGGATGSYSLKFRSLADSVSVLSARASVSDGYLSIVGEVLNNTGYRRTFVEVVATFYNASNRVVGTSSGFGDLTVVSARHRTPFEIFDSAPSGFDHYRLTVSSETTSQSPIGNLTVSPGVPSTDDIGYRHYPGELRNGNSYTVSFAEVIGVIYGPYGTVYYRELTFTDPDKIGAKRSAPYDLSFASTAGSNGLSYYVDASRA